MDETKACVSSVDRDFCWSLADGNVYTRARSPSFSKLVYVKRLSRAREPSSCPSVVFAAVSVSAIFAEPLLLLSRESSGSQRGKT